jgi:hypothetical protein
MLTLALMQVFFFGKEKCAYACAQGSGVHSFEFFFLERCCTAGASEARYKLSGKRKVWICQELTTEAAWLCLVCHIVC